VSEAQRGGPPAPSRPGSSAYPSDTTLDGRLDGRLDLDDLDSTLDLDVIGEDSDRPLLSEQVRRILESSGIAPFVRRHRTAVVAGVVVTALVLGSAGLWWVSRPVPLPDAPLLLVKSSGPDREQVTIDPAGGSVLGLTLSVAVASVERVGVAVELLALTGPGLTAPDPGRRSLVDTSVTDSVATVSAGLDCTTPASADAAVAAEPADFGLVVRRVAPEGETRQDRIRLVGAQRLAQLVRSTCLQAVADRELSVTSVLARPLAGVAAADLDLVVTNTGTRAWPGLRTSTRALPWLVNGRAPSDLAPGGTAELRTRVWLQDCADPSSALAQGLELRTSLTVEDLEPNAPDNDGNTFAVPVDAATRGRVTSAFAALCSSATPAATVTQAIVHTGGTDRSAGTLELTLAVRAEDAALMEVAQGGSTAAGTLTPLENPVHLTRGRGELHAAWELPRCVDLLSAGLPHFSVNLVGNDGNGGAPRPYVMSITGDELRVAIGRVCGGPLTGLVP
jgi:hypothetical protein